MLAPVPAGPGTRRLLVASGKVAHELEARLTKEGRQDVAVLRLEVLYPFPSSALAAQLAAYPKLDSVTFVQEEPRNMGAFGYVAPRLQPLLPAGVELGYAGRAAAASPSEGSMKAHLEEQERLLADAVAALEPGASA